MALPALLGPYVTAGVFTGCAPTPPERPAVTKVEIATQPEAAFDAIPPVVWFRVHGVPGPAAALLLFEDVLSPYYEARVKNADLPSTLLERRVPATAFEDPIGGGFVLAPSRRLAPRATYTLAALGRGTLTTVVVASEAPPFASRIFPPGASPGGARWVFCGAELTGRTDVVLEPTALDAVVSPGAVTTSVGGDCFRLEVSSPPDSGLVLPPPEVTGIALDPAPVSFQSARAGVAPLACKSGEIAFGPGCAKVQDDRIVVRTGPVPLVWSFEVNGETRVMSTPGSGRFVILDLEPSSPVVVAGAASDGAGRETAVDAQVSTNAPALHVVVNEVLANPNGAEPAQEWIELVNDGRVPVSLEGFTIGDADAAVSLPAVVLEPDTFALVVPEAFDVGGRLDVAPREGTLLVRVPHLGQSGLSNSGERVTLRGPDGSVVSSFPPIAPTAAGVSMARRLPSVLDDDTTGFGPSAGRGASPGAPNEVAGGND
jgi:hypothetical protein